MTLGLAAMLTGLFGIPVLLLWAGHRLRNRSELWRAGFWGAVVGHGIASAIAVAAAMYPPMAYGPDDVLRGALGFWLLPAGPLVAALVVMIARSRRKPSPKD